jgi:hypothetical protein
MRTGRFGVLIVMLAAVSACQLKVPSIVSGAPSAPQTLRISSSSFEVNAPDGYCFDLDTLTESADSSFVLMASCDPLLGNEVEDDHTKTSLLSLTLSPPVDGGSVVTVEQMQNLFETPDGQSLLASSGAADDVTVLWSGTQDGIVLVHASDSSRSQSAGRSQDLWRAMTVVENRILSVTSAQFENTQFSQPTRKTLVLQVVADFKTNNISTPDEIVSN